MPLPWSIISLWLVHILYTYRVHGYPQVLSGGGGGRGGFKFSHHFPPLTYDCLIFHIIWSVLLWLSEAYGHPLLVYWLLMGYAVNTYKKFHQMEKVERYLAYRQVKKSTPMPTPVPASTSSACR